MKKILALVCAASLAVTLFGCSSGKGDSGDKVYTGTYSRDLEGTTLNVFNWGEYISDGSEDSFDVNKEFEKLTGIKVNYSYYDNNEAMYSKLKSGAVAYDIIIPSDYMIERLKNEGMLERLDFSKLDNYKYIPDEYKDLYFDENNEYSVPYNVGMVGLIYNKTMVEGEPTSWNIMWDSKYADDILTFNNPRDAFGIAQFLLGLDINSNDTADWDKAAAKLTEQNAVLQARVNDEVFNKMEQGNAAVAAYYAGDYLTMAEVNPDLGFVYPDEGVNIFVDSVCVPKGGQNYDAAMMYINFLLEPEVALANAEYIRYASPNTAVIDNDEYSLKGNEYLYPAKEDMPKCEYFHDLPEDVRSYYESLWDKVLVSD